MPVRNWRRRSRQTALISEKEASPEKKWKRRSTEIEEALNNMEILESDPDGEYTRKMKDKLSACLDAVREVIQGVYNQENIQKGRSGDYGTDTE